MRRRGFGLALVCLALTPGVASAAESGFFTFTPFTLPFPGTRNATPEAINNLGQIVGSYRDAAGHTHGFVRDPQGHFSTIDVVLPEIFTSDTLARGINDFGVTVGSYIAPAGTAGRRIHGFMLARGVYTSIDTPFASAFNTRPRGINDYGAIVGSYDTAAGRHAFMRSAGVFRRVAVPFAGADRFAFACTINNLGQVPGSLPGYGRLPPRLPHNGSRDPRDQFPGRCRNLAHWDQRPRPDCRSLRGRPQHRP